MGGPDKIPTFVSGAAHYGAYLDVQITGGQLLVQRLGIDKKDKVVTQYYRKLIDFSTNDDDADGIINRLEDIDGDLDLLDEDTDGDNIPNYLDTDDDGDGILTINERSGNSDCDNVPDYLDNAPNDQCYIYLPLVLR